MWSMLVIVAGLGTSSVWATLDQCKAAAKFETTKHDLSTIDKAICRHSIGDGPDDTVWLVRNGKLVSSQ